MNEVGAQQNIIQLKNLFNIYLAFLIFFESRQLLPIRVVALNLPENVKEIL
jgi:hypothetical protein